MYRKVSPEGNYTKSKDEIKGCIDSLLSFTWDCMHDFRAMVWQSFLITPDMPKYSRNMISEFYHALDTIKNSYGKESDQDIIQELDHLRFLRDETKKFMQMQGSLRKNYHIPPYCKSIQSFHDKSSQCIYELEKALEN